MTNVAIVLASYHILVFAVWFGDSSDSTISPQDFAQCENERSRICMPVIGGNKPRIPFLCKYRCERLDFDPDLCSQIDIQFDESVQSYVVADTGEIKVSVLDKCLDIVRMKAARGLMADVSFWWQSVSEGLISVLTAVVILLLVRIY